MDTDIVDGTFKVERRFRMSNTIGKIAEALAAAQGEMPDAKKDSTNPFFKSKYADLASVRRASTPHLSKHGLAIVQFPRSTDDGVEVETLLVHSSGEWFAETLGLPVAKSDAQGIGSALTYARRYGWSAITGLATEEEDDGNAAAASAKTVREKAMPVLQMAASKGTAELERAWKTITTEQRTACKNDLAALKAHAAKHDPQPVGANGREPGAEG